MNCSSNFIIASFSSCPFILFFPFFARRIPCIHYIISKQANQNFVSLVFCTLGGISYQAILLRYILPNLKTNPTCISTTVNNFYLLSIYAGSFYKVTMHLQVSTLKLNFYYNILKIVKHIYNA